MRVAREPAIGHHGQRQGHDMKEGILDVLLYLFEHYFAAAEGTDLTLAAPGKDEPLVAELQGAGFSPAEIRNAFDWLDALARRRPAMGPTDRHRPTRVFHASELDKLDIEARGFLLYLEQQGVLDVDQRELVLDRALALDLDLVGLDDLKWVVLMVLFNQPGAEAAYAWMETQMFLDEPEPVH